MTLKNILKKEVIQQFIRFCLVGVAGATLNYSIFFLLYHFLSVYYSVSSGIGFICSIFLAFFLNKKFTFKLGKDKKTKTRIIKYFLVNLSSLLLGLFFLNFFVEILYINVYIANFFVIGIQTVSNFTGSRLFAFK